MPSRAPRRVTFAAGFPLRRLPALSVPDSGPPERACGLSLIRSRFAQRLAPRSHSRSRRAVLPRHGATAPSRSLTLSSPFGRTVRLAAAVCSVTLLPLAASLAAVTLASSAHRHVFLSASAFSSCVPYPSTSLSTEPSLCSRSPHFLILFSTAFAAAPACLLAFQIPRSRCSLSGQTLLQQSSLPAALSTPRPSCRSFSPYLLVACVATHSLSFGVVPLPVYPRRFHLPASPSARHHWRSSRSAVIVPTCAACSAPCHPSSRSARTPPPISCARPSALPRIQRLQPRNAALLLAHSRSPFLSGSQTSGYSILLRVLTSGTQRVDNRVAGEFLGTLLRVGLSRSTHLSISSLHRPKTSSSPIFIFCASVRSSITSWYPIVSLSAPHDRRPNGRFVSLPIVALSSGIFQPGSGSAAPDGKRPAD